MNIFAIYENPVAAAINQCNRHVVKMPLEAAQMMSLAHRVLDGTETRIVKNNRRKTVFLLEDEREDILYQPTHVNHPCSIWCRENKANYKWLYDHFMALCQEYTERYGRIHKCERVLAEMLSNFPDSIPDSNELTPFVLTMPDQYKKDDRIQAYRDFYCSKQLEFDMVWPEGKIPSWFRRIGA